MAFTLQGSGLATLLRWCVVVDDDDTVTDFVLGNTISLDSGVAASVNTGSWKSISNPKYFVTTAASFNYNGVRWTGTKPSAANGPGATSGLGTFSAFHGAGNCDAFCQVFTELCPSAGQNAGPGRVSSANAKGKYVLGGASNAITATNLPTDGTTKFSFATNYIYNSSSEVFYGLESGSLASDGTAGPDGGFGSDSAVAHGIGGSAGNGANPQSKYIDCGFSRTLTLSEYQSLHNDWFGTLFEQAVGNSLIPMYYSRKKFFTM